MHYINTTRLKITILCFLFVGKMFSQANCDAPPVDLVPINDLGKEISPFTGMMGGLYPNGLNDLPTAHKEAGLDMAAQVQCLDQNGNTNDANGKVVWLSIGMSNTTQETAEFITLANDFRGKNPALTLVNGAVGGMTASTISNPTDPDYKVYWDSVSIRLARANVSEEQVQIIWLKEANAVQNSSPWSYYDSLYVQYKRILNDLKIRFPNVKLCYLSSRISGRYASINLNPEPYSYLQGWVIKQLIEDQINGDPELTYRGSESNSPWLSWGIYMWSNGDIPQESNPNVFFECPIDFADDGTHPSTEGSIKVGELLLDFFSTDITTSSWFMGNDCLSKEQVDNYSISVYPNPTSGRLVFSFEDKTDKEINLNVYNAAGQLMYSQYIYDAEGLVTLDISHLIEGIYFLRATINGETEYNNKIVLTK